MKELHFTYEMQIKYSENVSRCNFTIKCMPKDTLRQKIKEYKIDVYPSTHYCTGVDGLRNLQIYGVNEHDHNLFIFKIEGIAVTGLSRYEENAEDDIAMIFKHPHGLNVPGDAIKSFYQKIRPKIYYIKECEKNKSQAYINDYEISIAIMRELHNHFQYMPFSTNVDTNAEEAFVQGHGVCQDYAHIFISLLHLAGIPARYVTGLIVGEGASHAWVEILCNGKWYGLDPTNNTVVSDEHIKIGIGRDARDCVINRGIMHGGGLHTPEIKVSVKEIQRKEQSD